MSLATSYLGLIGRQPGLPSALLLAVSVHVPGVLPKAETAILTVPGIGEAAFWLRKGFPASRTWPTSKPQELKNSHCDEGGDEQQ
jgi:hypothetical protein